MTHLAMFLDSVGVVTALVAAWLWYLSGRRRLRRVSRFEELDYHDLNRIVTAYNRNSVLNGRAALATAASAVTIALRFLLDLLARM